MATTRSERPWPCVHLPRMESELLSKLRPVMYISFAVCGGRAGGRGESSCTFMTLRSESSGDFKQLLFWSAMPSDTHLGQPALSISRIFFFFLLDTGKIHDQWYDDNWCDPLFFYQNGGRHLLVTRPVTSTAVTEIREKKKKRLTTLLRPLPI